MTIEEAAKKYGVSARTVMRWIGRDGAPSTRARTSVPKIIKGPRTFDPQELAAWLAANPWMLQNGKLKRQRHGQPGTGAI